MADLLNLKQGQERINPQQVMSVDGAINIREGTVVITKGSVCVITLAAPAFADNGKRLLIRSQTAFAHTVTNTTPGFNNAGAAQDVGTFAAAVGNLLEAEAYNGVWWVIRNLNVTLA
jgi:hypothetical protein